ncbi:HtaA domain-containing protein [Brevibacterium sp. 'Marine']|uniref:HtaA domain-containing protein n=1 Tax=Brevibacterium sp. 'Marine' TaxID=2725563 RepID=UPI00145C69ED|nr:HtaA domain-containing protein [Brevibacterium sp. 'Marine']
MSTPSAHRRADVGFAWAVKSSFVNYIRSSHDGSIEIDDGAAITPSSEFHFELESVGADRSLGQFAFNGEVRFRAHLGFLSIDLRNPRIVMRRETAELAVEDGDGGWLHLAHLSLPEPINEGAVTMWAEAPATLSEEGAELFGGSYSAGEQLAPLTMRLPTAALAPADTGMSG